MRKLPPLRGQSNCGQDLSLSATAAILRGASFGGESERIFFAFVLIASVYEVVSIHASLQQQGKLKGHDLAQLILLVSIRASHQQGGEPVPTESHINRLKTLKRSMYGRAKFDLLRIRIMANPKRAWV
jgi:hypothetical protein